MSTGPEFASFGHYSSEALRVVFAARHELARLGGERVEPEHLLLALLQPGAGAAFGVLSPLDHEALRRQLEEKVAQPGPSPDLSDVSLSDATRAVLDRAVSLTDGQVRGAHLLLALLGTGRTGALLAALGVTEQRVRAALI